MHHYCCYFDHRYLTRALAMMRSLRRYEPDATFWALCLDRRCFELMSALNEPRVNLIELADFEAGDEALAAARRDRSLIEYYFTCTPSLILYVLQRCGAGDPVTYVDGDLYFFSDPAPLYEELGAGSVSLIPHRFPEALREKERYGKYNVGWLTFRNDQRGVAAARWWRERCNEWCFDVLEHDRFADQKYLDRFPTTFDGVVVLQHDGANVAPWNLARYELVEREGRLFVNDTALLIFFHFHGLKTVGRHAYRAAHRPYRAPFRGVVRRRLYKPYVALLALLEREVFQADRAPPSLVRHEKPAVTLWSRLRAESLKWRQLAAAFARSEIIFVVGGKAV
jgi:hypothetical protein